MKPRPDGAPTCVVSGVWSGCYTKSENRLALEEHFSKILPEHFDRHGGLALEGVYEPIHRSFLLWQVERELKPALNPFAELFGGNDAGRGDVDHTAQRLAGEIHLPRVLFLERSLISCRPDTYHQLIADNTAAHMPLHHKGQSSEHPALNDIRAIRQLPADTFGQFLVVCHQIPPV